MIADHPWIGLTGKKWLPFHFISQPERGRKVLRIKAIFIVSTTLNYRFSKTNQIKFSTNADAIPQNKKESNLCGAVIFENDGPERNIPFSGYFRSMPADAIGTAVGEGVLP
jgi:hypothetical protein